MVKITNFIHLLMVFMHVSIQFWTQTQIRIRLIVSDPCGSGSGSTALILSKGEPMPLMK
jgi:hypothetical protein